jgi:hypothetical protein
MYSPSSFVFCSSFLNIFAISKHVCIICYTASPIANGIAIVAVEMFNAVADELSSSGISRTPLYNIFIQETTIINTVSCLYYPIPHVSLHILY